MQPVLFAQQGQVRTVYPAANTQHAIVLAAAGPAFYFVNQLLQVLPALFGRQVVLFVEMLKKMVITDHVSELLFCSSQKGVDNLAAEGITQGVHVVGDIMYSALLNFRPVAEQEVYHKTAGLGKYYLMTIHREENTSNTHNLKQILKALGKTDARLVWPIHPRTKKIIEQQGIAIPANLEIRDPFSYLEMLNAINGCAGVITDSGGVQKEAYWLKKRCITIRTETEWVETLAGNWNMLVNPNAAELAAALAATPVGEPDIEVYGDGRAHHKIAELIGRQWA